MNKIKNKVKNIKLLYYPLKIVIDLIREFKYIIIKLFLISLRCFKIKNNRVLVVSYTGKGFGDNSKYVVLDLLKDINITNIEIYWAVSNMNESFPKGIKKVKYNSIKYFYILVTSKIWLDNTRKPIYIIKRKKQIYIQFWHGCLAMKKIEFDASDRLSKIYLRGSKNDNNMINYLVSNSKYCSNILYKEALKCDKPILEYGCPREDILIKKNIELIKKVKKFYKVDEDKKIILYAPTFRNIYTGQYNIKYNSLLSKINTSLGEEYVVLVRLHPNVSSNAKEYGINFNKNVIDASGYNDIQELIVSSDLIITDYSSVMFDGLIANIPVILYVNDYDDYYKERGFYFSFDELPFKICKNNDELIEMDFKKYYNDVKKNYSKFKDKIGFYNHDNSSNEISKFIKEVINNEK